MLLVQLQQDSPSAPDTCPMTQLLPLAPAPVHMCLASTLEACASCSKLHPGLLEGAGAGAAGAAAGPGPAGAGGGAETGAGVSHGSQASASSAPVRSWSAFRSEALRCCTQRARLLLSKRRMGTAAGDALGLEAAGEGLGADVMGGARGPVAAAGGLATATSAFVKCNGCSMGGVWSDIRCSEGEKRGETGRQEGRERGITGGRDVKYSPAPEQAVGNAGGALGLLLCCSLPVHKCRCFLVAAIRDTARAILERDMGEGFRDLLMSHSGRCKAALLRSSAEGLRQSSCLDQGQAHGQAGASKQAGVAPAQHVTTGAGAVDDYGDCVHAEVERWVPSALRLLAFTDSSRAALLGALDTGGGVGCGGRRSGGDQERAPEQFAYPAAVRLLLQLLRLCSMWGKVEAAAQAAKAQVYGQDEYKAHAQGQQDGEQGKGCRRYCSLTRCELLAAARHARESDARMLALKCVGRLTDVISAAASVTLPHASSANRPLSPLGQQQGEQGAPSALSGVRHGVQAPQGGFPGAGVGGRPGHPMLSHSAHPWSLGISKSPPGAAMAGAMAGAGPRALVELLEAACTAGLEYCQPRERYSSLGLLPVTTESRQEYVASLGRALAGVQVPGGAGGGSAEGEDGEEAALARCVMLRSCVQVALWCTWCLGLV